MRYGVYSYVEHWMGWFLEGKIITTAKYVPSTSITTYDLVYIFKKFRMAE